MRHLQGLQDLTSADPDVVGWLIYEQLEDLRADGQLSDEAWRLVCALLREHELLLQAIRTRSAN